MNLTKEEPHHRIGLWPRQAQRHRHDTAVIRLESPDEQGHSHETEDGRQSSKGAQLNPIADGDQALIQCIIGSIGN